MKITEITEASYEGNIGIMELMQFFKAAPPELVLKVKELMDKGANKEVWQIVQKYTGTKLPGAEFEEAIQRVTEAFDKPYPISMKKKHDGGYFGVAKLDDGSALDVSIDLADEGFDGMDTFDVSFYRGGSTTTTGAGDAFKVFATVMSAIKQFIMQYRRDSEDGKSPYMITFSASKAQGDAPGGNAQSRAKLYDRMVKRFANQMGYKVYVEDYEVSQEYELTRKR